MPWLQTVIVAVTRQATGHDKDTHLRQYAGNAVVLLWLTGDSVFASKCSVLEISGAAYKIN